MPLEVLSVASEAVPLVKTGGLADVVGALPAALAGEGVRVTTLLPGYSQVLASLPKGKRAIARWDSLLGTPARLLAGDLDGHPLLVLDAPALFVRDGGIYGNAAGIDWPDNWRRFATLSRAAADIAGGMVKKLRFGLVHAHDWQAGMVPAYLRFS
ncbi:MAG: glycogen/starch synthase, partial [Pseudomonadota bacterium]